ncbi:MAG: hypothetical protein A2Y10_16455 [Planctomycetes bacterium GWF2_41_51]|nr:MAG: hypothetical protein A2Y10_16455 [Planctomycetes bacterium GWF2_41_51]HBG27912.1 hypothetical protein [Phycisphaerales bacterium]
MFKIKNEDIMTVSQFRKILSEVENLNQGDFQIWLSSDEEGNNFSPMLKKTELSFGVDKKEKKTFLFPSQ